jgi:hypothetical protein
MAIKYFDEFNLRPMFGQRQSLARSGAAAEC